MTTTLDIYREHLAEARRRQAITTERLAGAREADTFPVSAPWPDAERTPGSEAVDRLRNGLAEMVTRELLRLERLEADDRAELIELAEILVTALACSGTDSHPVPPHTGQAFREALGAIEAGRDAEHVVSAPVRGRRPDEEIERTRAVCGVMLDVLMEQVDDQSVSMPPGEREAAARFGSRLGALLAE